MNKRETIDIAFIAAVAVILIAAFIYVNLPGEEEEEAADEGGEESGSEEVDAGTEGGESTGGEETPIASSIVADTAYREALC